jgi:hypothetical protein
MQSGTGYGKHSTVAGLQNAGWQISVLAGRFDER